MNKYENLVVDGETEEDKGRQLVAGLRLLRRYGRLAEACLKSIEKGGDVRLYAPFVERFDRSHRGYKNHYTVTPAAVHSDLELPALPDYSGLSFQLRKIPPSKPSPLSKPATKKEESVSSGYLIYASCPSIGVFPNGVVRDIVCDEPIGSIWSTKTRLSWGFNNMSDTKSGKAAVTKALSEVAARVLVKLCSDGSREVWHSRASRAHSVLRQRCQSSLLQDGHAERIRQELIASLTVNEVHAT